MTRPPLIAVCGASVATQQQLDDARRCGELLAQAGAVVLNGGLGGVMAACAAGVAAAGGVCIGILPGASADEAADALTVAIPTGMGEMRNAVIARAASGVIAIGGGWGTLSEIAFAMRIGTPVVLLRSWQLTPPDGAATAEPMHAGDPDEAVEKVLRSLSAR